MKKFLEWFLKKKYIVIISISIIVIGFIAFFWSIFIPNKEVNVTSDTAPIWFVISLLILFVCGIVIKFSLFEEKLFGKLSQLFTKMSDFEDNIVVLTQEVKSDINDIIHQINRGDLDGVSEKFKSNDK